MIKDVLLRSVVVAGIFIAAGYVVIYGSALLTLIVRYATFEWATGNDFGISSMLFGISEWAAHSLIFAILVAIIAVWFSFYYWRPMHRSYLSVFVGILLAFCIVLIWFNYVRAGFTVGYQYMMDKAEVCVQLPTKVWFYKGYRPDAQCIIIQNTATIKTVCAISIECKEVGSRPPRDPQLDPRFVQ